jgi:hypothetical protein
VAAGVNTRLLEDLTSSSPRRVSRTLSLVQQAAQATPIRSATEALDVFDFEPVARAKMSTAHWAYLATGTDDDGTIRANREGFDHWALKPRRLVNVESIDASVSLFGTSYARLFGSTTTSAMLFRKSSTITPVTTQNHAPRGS